MYTITTTNRFEKEVKICIKRGYDISLLKSVMEILAENGTLPSKYKPHKLSGNYNNCWECHIKPDWLLIWQQNDTELVLLFMNTGTHSDLF
ncbi:MAG: type II toxin-antitoxin system mRNA interferase toxin, RelE/StbE family [Bacteroidetes bacterium HGW-Bacteroidetes-23]|nr:MAG: type II toxin-antitoxin system mRNA interferase toxin, RelE/StbE family [Bacteroidetes bacterium HGW-Bacteroidetes-23]